MDIHNPSPEYQAGSAAGARWASEVATVAQLLNFARFFAAFRESRGDLIFDKMLSWPSWEYMPRFAGVIGGQEDYDRTGQFWAKAADNFMMASSKDYALGWLIGVTDTLLDPIYLS